MFFEELLQPRFDSLEEKNQFLQPYQWRILYFHLALQCQLPILDSVNAHFPLLAKQAILRAIYSTTVEIFNRISSLNDLISAPLHHYFRIRSKDNTRSINIDFDTTGFGIKFKDLHRRGDQNSVDFYITNSQQISMMDWTEEEESTFLSFRHLAFEVDQKISVWIPQLLK